MTTRSPASGARFRRRASADRTSPDSGGKFMQDFLEHILRGTELRDRQDGHADGLHFVPREGLAELRRRPRAHGHRARNCERSTKASRCIASFPELKTKPIVIGESDPDGCAACQGPQLGYRNGTMFSSYTAASLRAQTSTRRKARRKS